MKYATAIRQGVGHPGYDVLLWDDKGGKAATLQMDSIESAEALAGLLTGVSGVKEMVAHRPVVGPLLDIWDGLPNDLKSDEALGVLRCEIERLSDIVDE